MKEAKEPEKKPGRPYAPPRIKTETLYERRALACGKMPRRPIAQCRSNPKIS